MNAYLSKFCSHEELAAVALDDIGARAVIAIHSTHLGPAAGGFHLRHSLDEDVAVADALRLSRRASYRNALAGLPLGGGQAILLMSRGDQNAILRQFGRVVDGFGGRYIFTEDQASQAGGLQAPHAASRYLQGRGRAHGRVAMDLSRWAAFGAFLCIQATLLWWMGKKLEDATVAVDGATPMAGELCRHLVGAGATIVVADTNPDHARILAYTVGARVARADNIHRVAADVFAPCTAGRRLDLQRAMECSASIVCGAAEDQLADAAAGSALHARGILYCPDIVVSAGGAIGLHYRDTATIKARMTQIPARLLSLLEAAANDRMQPELMAGKMARARLDRDPRAGASTVRQTAVLEMGELR